MTPLVAALDALAFHRASPADANRAIDEARGLRGRGGAEATSYELALPALDPDAWLAHQALPKLVYFLDCRGIHPPASGDVFVSLFTAEGLLFADAGPVVEALARARGLTLAEVVRRYGADGTGEPKQLGV